uniref:Uncharacterized protein n=1 Tax=Lotus japonicus TaxID=34305 RepID=I3T171_LOTJA|nr:unknown [Lotus japonicus]
MAKLSDYGLPIISEENDASGAWSHGKSTQTEQSSNTKIYNSWPYNNDKA